MVTDVVSSAFFKIFIYQLIGVEIFTSLKPMATKFGRQEHLDDINHLILIKLILVLSSCYYHITLKFCYFSFSARNMITKFR